MTVEPQYNRFLKLRENRGVASLGLTTNWWWKNDPKHLLFHLARYKFVAKMLASWHQALEIGVGDGFGTNIVGDSVYTLHTIDNDPIFVEDASRQVDRVFSVGQHDIVWRATEHTYDAAYAIDVIEHIPQHYEAAFMQNICASLSSNGILILGTPSLESQVHASDISKEGHVNCKTGDTLREMIGQYFHNVFIFSMNDEVVHTGFTPMAHYLFGMGVGVIDASENGKAEKVHGGGACPKAQGKENTHGDV